VAGFNKLSEAFEQGRDTQQDRQEGDQKNGTNDDAVKRSLSIVNAVDKMKAAGIKITAKAEMDYMLALRILERSDIDLNKLYVYRREQGLEPDPRLAFMKNEPPPKKESLFNRLFPAKEDRLAVEDPPADTGLKRNPKDHPEEFKKAMAASKQVVAQVEAEVVSGKKVSHERMNEYDVCKQFLEKYGES